MTRAVLSTTCLLSLLACGGISEGDDPDASSARVDGGSSAADARVSGVDASTATDASSAPDGASSFELVVSLGGVAGGSVVSSPPGIACGMDCSETYAADTMVALSASSVNGSGFTGWSGGCTGSAGCALTMDSAKAVTADFAATLYNFPEGGDTRQTMSGTSFWNSGDYVEGMRSTPFADVTTAVVHLELVSNSLTVCGFQNVRVLLNGTQVGTFQISMGMTAVDTVLSFGAVSGPNYTIRYETTATVQGGCGSAGYNNTGSTISLIP